MECFSQVIWSGQIEHHVTHQNHQFFILPQEQSGQRIILGLDDDAISNPLPELGLRGPKLLPVPAYDKCISFPGLFLRFQLVLFSVFSIHHDLIFFTHLPLACLLSAYDCGLKQGGTPQGKPRI